MRHRTAGKKLGRSPAHRRALLRNLVTELLEREAVKTTDAKAKELKRWGDRLITLGKAGTLHARRRAAGLVQRASWQGIPTAQASWAWWSGLGGAIGAASSAVIAQSPLLGDLAMSTMVKHFDKKGDLNRLSRRDLSDARPTE